MSLKTHPFPEYFLLILFRIHLQDFELWDDVGLNIPKPPDLLQLYRNGGSTLSSPTDKVDASVGVAFGDLPGNCVSREPQKKPDLSQQVCISSFLYMCIYSRIASMQLCLVAVTLKKAALTIHLHKDIFQLVEISVLKNPFCKILIFWISVSIFIQLL